MAFDIRGRDIILIDSGDTLIDEGSQVFDDKGYVISARLMPEALQTLCFFKQRGYKVILVADGRHKSFEIVHHQTGIYNLLDARVYSEDIGCEKPDVHMFERAFELGDFSEKDKNRAVMIGNNIKRDITGAHGFGIPGILIDWSPRYQYTPECTAEIPDAVAHDHAALRALFNQEGGSPCGK